MESLSSQGFDILQTRLFRPQLPGSLLERSRLVEMLDFAPPKVLTLVTAPAGFGKTTLVSSRLNEIQCPDDQLKPDCLPSAWLAIDETDNDFIFFLRHFITALRRIVPEACPETFNLAHSRGELFEESIPLVLTNEIAALSQRFVMVLDDFHRASSPQLLELLSGWIRHWPLPMHLVIISRTQPPLALSGLKGQGKINDIRSRDLRFSPQEAADYICLTTKRDPGEKPIADLLNQIEGWAAGLKLASIALNQTTAAQDIESVISLGRQDIISYLVDEVFSHMTEPMQRFLVKISILDDFCVSLCLALVNEDDLDESVRNLLDNINSIDLFITALQGKEDCNEDWFCMHHLMRNLLQKKLLKSINPEQVKSLHLRAAKWHTGCNHFKQALEYALKADNSELLAEILDQMIIEALNSEDLLLIDHLMQFVTGEMNSTNPQFLLYKAWQKYYRWDLNEINTIIGQVEKIMKSEKPAFMNQGSLSGQLAFFKGFFALASNSCPGAVELFAKALDLIPTRWNYVRGQAVFCHGLSLQSCENVHKAAACLQQSYRDLDNKNNSHAIRHLFALALIYLQDGDLKASEHYARLLLDKARNNKLVQQEGFALAILGFVNYQWNRLNLAEEWYRELYRMRKFTTIMLNRQGYIGLAIALQALGRSKEALAIINELVELELEYRGQVTEVAQVGRLRVLTSQNQEKEAEKWADKYLEPFADVLLLPNFEDPLIFKARVLITRNNPKDRPIIREVLSKYLNIAADTNNNRCKAEALALSALAESNAGNNTAARELMIESFKIAARGKMIRLYLDLGSQMHGLLKQAAPVAEIAEFVQELLGAFAESNARPLITNQTAKGQPGIYKDGAEQPFYENLSLRETEVLRLMAEAISLQEIADRLFITYATAKRHTINIYSKLGVHSRWEAVAFARKYGIL
jgi:LuxR family transcriptional regulator, maltose regulon positive regulatory protein